MNSRPAYALIALAIFGVEVLIALFVRDPFVRPYLGDVLAVMLVYCALRAATPLGMLPAFIATLAIALAIELAQLYRLLDAIGLGGDTVARIVLGGSFDWLDLAAYVAGSLIALAADAVFTRRAR